MKPDNHSRKGARFWFLATAFLGLFDHACLICVLIWSAFTVSAGELPIKFNAVYQGAPLVFNSLTNRTADGQIFSVTRLDFLLSNFSVRGKNGAWLEKTDQQVFLSLGEGRDRFTLAGIPNGTYDRLRFHVGVTPEINHGNPAKYPADHPLNPNLNGLHWGWQGGYVFFAIEGHWKNAGKAATASDAEAQSSGYSWHLGNDWNLLTVELPVNFNLSGDEPYPIALNLDKIFAAIHFGKDTASTHSRKGDTLAQQLVANWAQPAVLSQEARPHETVVSSSPVPVPAHRQPSAGSVTPPPSATPYRFTFSEQFPIPDLPRDNPLTEEGVELGHRLFGERALSINNSQSCASCHRAESAFSDPGKRFSLGAEKQKGTRNSMPIFNLAWKKSFFWDGRAATLREQTLQPIQNPIEMHETLDRVVDKIKRRAPYADLFDRAFGSPEITGERIAKALEQFLLVQLSYDSKFDRATLGKAELTDEEKRGFQLFMTEYDPHHEQFGADCFHCHGGPFFTTHGFANNGLDADFCDADRFKITGKESDKGKFLVPSLRNVEVTGPYMHDGRFKTLEEVVDHYSEGVKHSATLDPNLAKHPDDGMRLSSADKRALVAFLKTLTDERFRR